MPENSRYTPKGIRRASTSTAVAAQAPASAKSTAAGMAAFSVGLSKKPPLAWQNRAEAAVGRKNRRLMQKSQNL